MKPTLALVLLLAACGSSGGKVDGKVTIDGKPAKFGGCTKVGDKWRFPIGDMVFVIDVMNGKQFEKGGQVSTSECGVYEFESANKSGTMTGSCGSPEGVVEIDAKFSCD